MVLAKELFQRKIHLTGTIQTNRSGLPDDIKKGKIKLSQGNKVSLCKSNRYHVLSWRDKRYATMLTTYYSSETEMVQRFAKKKQKEEISKPIAISKYTENMGGVDRADQYCSSYAFNQKSVKWWRKLYFFIFDVCIVNSFLLYKIQMSKLGKKQLDHRQYRKQLCEQLVCGVRVKLRVKRHRPSEKENEVPERLKNDKVHIINRIPENRVRECAVCSDRYGAGGRKTAAYFCKTCPGNPALHPHDCFEYYHTKVDYKIKYN